jgi:hypothetical protein
VSEDALYSQLQKAASFMAEVRDAQFDSGRPLAGPARLTPDQRSAITSASADSNLVAAVKEALKVDLPVNRLFERFEEMCRRREIPIDHSQRPGILKLLAAELWTNAQQLQARPKDLIGVTVYHGNITPLAAEEEFVSLRDTPGIFKQAALNHPTDPRGFLRKVQKNIAVLAAEEEFAPLRDTPGIFTRAAAGNPSDPRGFLRQVQKDITALATEEEFAPLRDTPGIFTRAAIHNPTDPRAFLRKVQKDIAVLAAEKEFAPLRDTPSIFTRAAVNNPSDPRALLRKVQAHSVVSDRSR